MVPKWRQIHATSFRQSNKILKTSELSVRGNLREIYVMVHLPGNPKKKR